LGIALASMSATVLVCEAIADTCCKNTYSWGGGGSGGPCSGDNTTVCEVGAPDANPGKRLTGSHTATCMEFYDTEFARAPCSSDPGPEWVKLPGKLDDGSCCFALAPAIMITQLDYSVGSCNGMPCAGPGGEN
jgi:hypothetical protein